MAAALLLGGLCLVAVRRQARLRQGRRIRGAAPASHLPRSQAQRHIQSALAEQLATLQACQRALEQANKDLTDFAYAAGHDLKTPVSSMRLWLSMFRLEAGARLSPADLALLGDADTMMDRMHHLLEGIGLYATLLGAEQEPRRMTDLTKLFRREARALSPEVRAAGARIEIDALPHTRCVPRLIALLARHLLSNAVRYRAPGRKCRIKVTGELVRAPRAEVVLRVRDTGRGIAPEQQTRIFDLFNRLHGPDDGDGSGLGLGLGLAICRRVAAAHGGTLEVVSEVGLGAEFVLRFPVSPAVEDRMHVA